MHSKFRMYVHVRSENLHQGSSELEMCGQSHGKKRCMRKPEWGNAPLLLYQNAVNQDMNRSGCQVSFMMTMTKITTTNTAIMNPILASFLPPAMTPSHAADSHHTVS